jgi:HIRAN domain
MTQWRTIIVGTKFRGKAAVVALGQLRQGDALELRREPDNPHDSNAIAVYHGSDHLGYVPRTETPGIAAAIDAGTLLSTSLEVEAIVDVNARAVLFAPKITIRSL